MTPDDAAKPPCPRCTSHDARCLHTVWVEGKGMSKRRRECLVCGQRYTTYEAVVDVRQHELVIRIAGSTAILAPTRYP